VEGLVLTVRDQGIGMEPELSARVFELFAQAKRSSDRSQGGLGLGLALVKGLIELHGGQVEAASDGPGQGSEFVLRLPLAEDVPAPPTLPPSCPSSAGSLRIVVIEDHPDNADSLRMVLVTMGHQVRVALTGPDGVRLAVEWRPDVVLSDIGLPGLDGFGVARELRHHPATSGVRLIAITGYGQEGQAGACRDAGFEQVLTKPVDPAVLQGLLQRAGSH
jgi:CheY-like chemotaxis protein